MNHVLSAFRSTREVVPDKDPLVAVELFNVMLFAAGLAKDGAIDRRQLERAATVGEVFDVFSAEYEADLQSWAAHVSSEVRQRRLFATLSRFLAPEPRFSYTLDPWLLLRHASGDLYQEAHLVLEENAQLTIAGVAPQKPKGTPRLGVRFTPPTLARALAEQALSSAPLDKKTLTILDPACGSGVFLIEAVRELIRRNHGGKVVLRGIDLSPVSAAMARFCLRFAIEEARDAGVDASAEVITANSLTCDWTDADVILTNPPFVPWGSIDDESRELLRAEMGPLMKGRTDLAMAFILRAARSIRAGGAVSAVLPSPLLESTHGSAWREELGQIADVNLIGRFEGYSYFRASMVEPAFVVLRKKNASEDAAQNPDGIDVLIARPGAEEKSLRSLRHPEIPLSPSSEWSLYRASRDILRAGKWMPRWPESNALEVQLAERGTPRVGDLFDVRQGALTGHNMAFLLKTAGLEQLPAAERAYFKPAAGTRTISEGRIDPGHWVFYPYANGQLLIRTERELFDAVPTFYDWKLRPNLKQLQARQGINVDVWWGLTRARDRQRLGVPKLVSSYFGKQGGFAYDARGGFVVVHGYAWLWKAKQQEVEFDGEPIPIEIDLKEDLALAYLAILNSTIFEEALALACPRVAGTQFNLSKRFVTRVFIPDLTDELIPTHTVAELARFGSGIHQGDPPHLEEINRAVAAAYRVDLAVFDAVAEK